MIRKLHFFGLHFWIQIVPQQRFIYWDGNWHLLFFLWLCILYSSSLEHNFLPQDVLKLRKSRNNIISTVNALIFCFVLWSKFVKNRHKIGSRGIFIFVLFLYMLQPFIIQCGSPIFWNQDKSSGRREENTSNPSTDIILIKKDEF